MEYIPVRVSDIIRQVNRDIYLPAIQREFLRTAKVDSGFVRTWLDALVDQRHPGPRSVDRSWQIKNAAVFEGHVRDEALVRRKRSGIGLGG